MAEKTIESRLDLAERELELVKRFSAIDNSAHRKRGILFASFVANRCRMEPGAKISAAQLHSAWTFWLRERGEREVPAFLMGKLAWLLPGVEAETRPIQGKPRRFYSGIDLVREPDSESANVPSFEDIAGSISPDYNPDRDYILGVFPDARIESKRIGLTIYDYWVDLSPGNESPAMPHADNEPEAWDKASSVVSRLEATI